MNLANAQLKMAGLPGIPHGDMDLVAARLTPEKFIEHFEDVIVREEFLQKGQNRSQFERLFISPREFKAIHRLRDKSGE